MKRKESPRTTRSVSSSSEEEEEENDHANEKDATRTTTTTTTGLSTRRRRNKNNNTKTSERSANESKATTTGKFLSRLLAEEKENESEDALVKKLEKATRRARFDEKNDEDVKEIGRTFEDDDDDDCKNPLVKGGDIRFIEASGKRTPTVRRVECKKKKEKTKRREHTTTEEKERRMLEEELSGTEKCLFAKHYSANVCVKAPSRCWFETTVESFRDEIEGSTIT